MLFYLKQVDKDSTTESSKENRIGQAVILQMFTRRQKALRPFKHTCSEQADGLTKS